MYKYTNDRSGRLSGKRSFFFPAFFIDNREKKKKPFATPWTIWPFTILSFAVYFLLLSLSEDRLASNNMNEMLDIEDRLKDMLA